MKNLPPFGTRFFRRAGLRFLCDAWLMANPSVRRALPDVTSTCAPSVAEIRFAVAINVFKMLLLGEGHQPGKAQTTAVFDALAKHGLEILLTERTWQSWFSPNSGTPKLSKVRVLDQMAQRIGAFDGHGEDLASDTPENFFEEMVFGGLVAHMTHRTTSSRSLEVILCERANSYFPLSALHLHLDALETASWVEDFGEISWTAIKKLAAERIFELLNLLWNRRRGLMYGSFCSSATSRSTRASDLAIFEGYRGFKPNPGAAYFSGRKEPAWQRIGSILELGSAPIHKLMFLLARDHEFLADDKLIGWALDLSTAALALQAATWCHRHDDFGVFPSEEAIFWAALDAIFFQSVAPERNNHSVDVAMSRCQDFWTDQDFEMFLRGRETYQGLVEAAGVDINKLYVVAMRATEIHPMEFVG